MDNERDSFKSFGSEFQSDTMLRPKVPVGLWHRAREKLTLLCLRLCEWTCEIKVKPSDKYMGESPFLTL